MTQASPAEWHITPLDNGNWQATLGPVVMHYAHLDALVNAIVRYAVGQASPAKGRTDGNQGLQTQPQRHA